jgi:hypothetical protein
VAAIASGVAAIGPAPRDASVFEQLQKVATRDRPFFWSGHTAGNVAPGPLGGIGTLTVNGNYTQGSSGTLTIQISPNAASQLVINGVTPPTAPSAPKLIAGGAANLNGTLALLFDPGVYKLGTSLRSSPRRASPANFRPLPAATPHLVLRRRSSTSPTRR